MNCFGRKSKASSSSVDQLTNRTEEEVLTIPSCNVHLMEEGEAVEIGHGDFKILRVAQDGVILATTVKVGDELQWPLTKDEPVVKVEGLKYLFTLPVKDGDPLSYGVSFSEEYAGNLELLDSFLTEQCCFSGLSSSAANRSKGGIDWKEFAPQVEDYKGYLARALAGGTGQVVKGIFYLSNAYTNQVQKGGEMIQTEASKVENGVVAGGSKQTTKKKRNHINSNLNRVRKLSRMTERMSKAMLDGVGLATGSVMVPIVRSRAGKAFLTMVPGEVLMVSLDAVNRVLDAFEAAQKQTLSATSDAIARSVTKCCGESAGEATAHVLATAGHCCGVAWNIFKFRKALNPSSYVTSASTWKSAIRSKKKKQ